MAAILIVMLLGSVPFYLFGRPSFPHRGDLVETLHHALTFPNVALLWAVIFWVGYETRACARFVAVLSDVKSVWPNPCLIARRPRPVCRARISTTISTSN